MIGRGYLHLCWVDPAKLPSVRVAPVCTPTSNVRGVFLFPRATPALGIIKPRDLCQSWRGPVVSQCTFNLCKHLTKSEVEQLFMCLIATLISFFVIHLFISFAYFSVD